MKIILALFAFIFSFGLFFPQTAQAHIILKDKAIQVFMHIHPNDQPLIHEEAKFFFRFSDTQQKFNLQECLCTFSLIQKGKKIYTKPITTTMFYTFHDPGIYTMTLSGKPLVPGLFEPFELQYAIRIEPEGKKTFPAIHVNHLLATYGVSVVIGGIILFSCIILIQKFLAGREGVKRE